VDGFELLDAAGKTVFAGKAECAKAEGAGEQISIHEKQDYTKAAVYRLDFGGFAVPGEYRVFVPGLGTSGPFRIAADVWEGPFRAAMQGILAQRQGIDLGPPACAFTRRRTFHPDDGVRFYQLEMTCHEGQEGARGERLLEQAKAGPLQEVAVVPGGYQDAGDWDTIGHHLSATYDLLGLYFLNPEAFARLKLVLPGEESRNLLPDLLDEALWQMPMWQSLQLPDGGVRGGYGDGWGCYRGETSSMLRYAGVYAPDHETSLRFAAAAARAARVLEAFDQGLAAAYLDSAQRAWAWAEAHASASASDPTYARLKARQGWPGYTTLLTNARAQAAVELLAATREPAYDEAFHQSSELAREASLYLEQADADFAYARLPEGLGDPALKRQAVVRIVAYADHALEFSRRNAYDLITGHRTDMPMIFVSRFFSTPGAGGFALIYAYELTRKPAYLAAAVQGTNYCLGANPDNLCYCSGVGYNSERFPFFVDVQVTGQYPDVPVGHIPYGQGNEGNEMSRAANGWVQQWLLNYGPSKKMIPNWYDWPVTEQYIDFGRYPLHNENCFNQTTVPAACYWFWLATRPELPQRENR
jgi:endoglucanase